MLITKIFFSKLPSFTLTFSLFGICYTIPTGVWLILTFLRKWRKGREWTWLYLLLFGATLFGVIDHLWNGEVFLIGENPLKDIALGVVITLSVFAVWGIMVFVHRKKATLAKKSVN
ncbi:MAG: hypothetical protein ABIK84_05065 [candidate division WOR-3 bacterium]